MHPDNPKVQTLLTQGPSHHQWPDYLNKFEFTAADVPALINLFADEEINKLPSLLTQISHIFPHYLYIILF